MHTSSRTVELEQPRPDTPFGDTTLLDNPFAQELIEGLSQQPKQLSCKWFYDERGSRLFEEITKTAEYYPTRVETRLLRSLSAELAQLLPNLAIVIEPGSGASIKTRILLEALPALQQYIPVDISEEFLLETARQLQQDFPRLDVMPIAADFAQPINPLVHNPHAERLVFFPGSTIGNFSPVEARKLLRNIQTWAGKQAWLLIGVDMTQDADTLLAAYNDAEGITAQFNKNLLVRANRELAADFNIANFHHEARLNTTEHRIEMHLVSGVAQTVTAEGHTFEFMQGETIHTENCYKYPYPAFEAMALECNWHIKRTWQDTKESGFAVFLLKGHPKIS